MGVCISCTAFLYICIYVINVLTFSFSQKIIALLHRLSKGSPSCVMVNVLDWNIVVCEFELQSFTFSLMSLGKV